MSDTNYTEWPQNRPKHHKTYTFSVWFISLFTYLSMCTYHSLQWMKNIHANFCGSEKVQSYAEVNIWMVQVKFTHFMKSAVWNRGQYFLKTLEIVWIRNSNESHCCFNERHCQINIQRGYEHFIFSNFYFVSIVGNSCK